MIILPGLHWMKVAGGGGDPTVAVHHLYMAAAMVTNIAVALPAAMQHKAAGAVRKDLLQPLLQMVCGVKLRESIATSSSIIWITAIIGATYKLVTLSQHGQSAWVALAIAAALAPTAVVGSKIGAWLTHALPVPVVRAVITAVLVVADSIRPE